MNLKEANKRIEQLENEQEYWLNQKESILSLVLPKSPNLNSEKVSGGKRCDKFLKYVETDEEKEISKKLDEIHNQKQNLLKWLENELKILKKYGEVESLIVQYKEKGKYDKEKERFIVLTWEEISKEVHYSKSFCRNIYRKYKQKRYID